MSKIDVKILGKYFWCPRFDNKRLVGSCLRCKTKGCKYKKALKYFWVNKFDGEIPKAKADRFTKNNPKYQWSPKKRKWFRWYYAEDGNVVVENSPAHFKLPPPSHIGGVDDGDGELDEEPAHIVLDNVE